ncbi:hypothetical protein [Hymenobacter sp. HDW8]|uniref:hypothetical protein n=1 Tax=Hymenobacter sp. HDW8 TaxID=2714932 RepID=UPI001F0FE93A|nr:hypothetical protein [Hymenobacter sp. HDW8]
MATPVQKAPAVASAPHQDSAYTPEIEAPEGRSKRPFILVILALLLLVGAILAGSATSLGKRTRKPTMLRWKAMYIPFCPA